MEKKDGQLAVDYLAGDKKAFDELLRRYLEPIFRFLRRLTGRREEAEDLAQEVFLKLWKNLGKFQADDILKSWLFQVAYNVFIDWTRKKKSAVFSDFDTEEGNGILDNLADVENLPDQAAILKESGEKLAVLVAKLPLLSQSILVMHYREGLSFEEIGRILKLPLNTVKSRYRRALIKLRSLADYGDF